MATKRSIVFILYGWMLSLLSASVYAQSSVVDCHALPQFAPEGFGRGSASGECYLWPGSTALISIYYPREWGVRMAPHRNARLQAVFEALNHSLAVYREQGLERHSSIAHITAGYTLNETDIGGTSADVQAIAIPNSRRDGQCGMMFYHAQIPNLAELRFVAAHELFHCVQQNSYGQRYNLSSYWWQEGSANLAANLAYPASNIEFNHTRGYVQEQELFNQGRGYPSAIFFQSYYNQRGAEQLSTVLALMPDTHDIGVQYSFFTHISNFDENFHRFAEQYISQQVSDSGGGFVAQPRVYYTQHGIVSGDTVVELSVSNYVVGAYRYDLAQGKRYIVNELRTQDLPRVSYRQGGGEWQLLPAQGEFTIEDSCNSPVSLEFALTAVSAAPDIYETQISFRTADCEEPAPAPCTNDRPLPACVQGTWQLTLDDLPRDRFPRDGIRLGGTHITSVNFGELYETYNYRLTVAADGHYSEELFQRTTKSGPSFNSTNSSSVTMRSDVQAYSEGAVCISGDELLFMGSQRMRHRQNIMGSVIGATENIRDYPASPITTRHQYMCNEEGANALPPFPFPANINVLRERARRLGVEAD